MSSEEPPGRIEIELREDDVDLLQEMLLRQFSEMVESGEWTREEVLDYSVALDAFLEASGRAGRIGEQPENVRNFWSEVLDDAR